MITYRLSRERFKNDLSGKGAELAGGRWNSIGTPVLYTADSRSLCALEIAVHAALNIVPDDYVMIAIEMPDHAEKEIPEKDLPEGWNEFPEIPETAIIGDVFCRAGKYLALKVPSAVTPGDYNFLINPRHKDFGQIKIISIVPFRFDQRLFIKKAAAK